MRSRSLSHKILSNHKCGRCDDSALLNTSSLARIHGEPLCHAAIKNTAADFRVYEELDIAFSGDGEHVWLRIQKTGLNTADVVAVLAEHLSVKAADIGYSGMKDKQAVTEQWFSVCTPADIADSDVLSSFGPELVVLDVQRHSRKLRHSTHDANTFCIVLRDIEWIDDADQTAFALRVEQLAANGFANYLGPQRFGFGGQNLKRAEAWFRQPKKRVSRQQRSLYLSAARSALFNAVCDARVRAGLWTSAMPGEPLVLDGSRSFFVPDTIDGEVLERMAKHDVHPSGPWWGRGESLASDQCAEFEGTTLADARWQGLCQGLSGNRLDQDRRALRAIPRNMSLNWLSDNECELQFSLAPGVFATMLLHELIVET